MASLVTGGYKMADLTPERKNIQIEESRFKFAVSESFCQKLGKSVNFLNYFQHSEKQFFINGSYNNNPSAIPFVGVDGMAVFEFDAEIIDVVMLISLVGSSGQTVLDIEWAPEGSTTFTSIFSTTPKITSAAANFSRCYVGYTMSGTVAPVLSKTTFAAKDVLRCNLTEVPTGSVQNTGLLVYYRPI